MTSKKRDKSIGFLDFLKRSGITPQKMQYTEELRRSLENGEVIGRISKYNEAWTGSDGVFKFHVGT